ncbi:MAG: thiamine pyrophosphate-binding protein [Solidesulfovibrio sp.]
MRATRYLLSSLAAEGVDHMFLVPGGLVDPFLSDLASMQGLTPIVAAHESGAAYMADGYARASGRFGVCLAIGGPGVTNVVTAAATASADASPVLFVTGQVPTDWEGRGGFQDSSPASFNDVALLAPVTAASLAVENPHLTPHHLRACLTKMLAGPKAPVHVSLPLDVQRSEVAAFWDPLDESVYHPRYVDDAAVERLWRILVPEGGGEAPSRVAILAGAGVEKSGATEALAAFAEQFEIPVATTLRAKGVFPEDHRLSLGIFGYAGHRHAIETFLSGRVEVLIVLGSGLSQRDTLFWDKRMLPSHSLVHVDVDPTAIGRTFHTHVPIVGDCRAALARMMEGGSARIMRFRAGNASRAAWIRTIRKSGPACYDPEQTTSEAAPLHPARVAAALRQALPRDGAVVVDSGAHRAFFAHYFTSYGPRTYYTAAGLGPMGWAVAAAVGVKAALPGRAVACVAGDGCMLMHGMEVATAARYGMNILYVVINNSALGNVWLRARKSGPETGALAELPTHDFAAFGRAMGARGVTVTTPDELLPALTEGLAGEGPCVVDVRCDKAFTTPVTPYMAAEKEWVDGS